MNINKLVIDTLKPLGIDVTYIHYSGNKPTYITFFEISAIDDDYSDNLNETEEHSLQIDLFTKDDPTELKNKIKKTLKGTFYNVTTADMYEADTKYYHIAFRCSFFEKIEEE